jgi:DNA-binding CsgD family transcriptional regulator
VGSRNGATDTERTAGKSPDSRVRPWNKLRAWLVATRAIDEEDRRRELTLNWILLALLALAATEAIQRLPAVIQGGPAAADHGPTFVLSCLAGASFAALLVLSRRGRQVLAARGLIVAYFAIIAWLFIAEGTEEPSAIILSALMVVTGGVLLGTRVSIPAVVLLTGTMLTVSAFESAKVLHVPAGHDIPGPFELLGFCGGLAILAVVLSARTSERHSSVGELLGSATAEPDDRIAALMVRELQVVRLIAAGKSNMVIAQELFLSPRTVHTHVSNALRKTGCTNRTELAILALSDRDGEPYESVA